MKKITKNALTGLLLAAIPLFILISIFGVVVPGNFDYDRQFGQHLKVYFKVSTFEEMREEIVTLWQKMNATFPENHSAVYNSPFYWQRTYDNSLAAQDVYFAAKINRLDLQIAAYNKMIFESDNTAVLGDWYDSARTAIIQDGVTEDWVLYPAFILQKYPAIYWFVAWFIPSVVFLLSMLAWIFSKHACDGDFNCCESDCRKPRPMAR